MYVDKIGIMECGEWEGYRSTVMWMGLVISAKEGKVYCEIIEYVFYYWCPLKIWTWNVFGGLVLLINDEIDKVELNYTFKIP